MDTKNIFISQTEADDNDISGKITYTEILNSMPHNKVETQMDNWRKIYSTEWRWRFLRFTIIDNDKEIDKYVVEISYMKYDSNKRVYFNRYGQWVVRDIDKAYDNFVEKEYYVYTN